MKNTTALKWHRCRIEDDVLALRMKMAHEKTIPSSIQRCYETGRIEAFKHNWKEGMPNRPHIYWDSDVAKVLEGIAYDIVLNPDEKLESELDSIVELIVASQLPDGYLNSYFGYLEPEHRWKNINEWHELYCAGHLIEAAVAHYEVTGKRNFLDAMCRYTDYIITVFGHGEGQIPAYPGHEEIELALCKLAAVTGEQKYFDLAKYFIDERGQEPNYFVEIEGKDPNFKHLRRPFVFRPDVFQAHIPVREQTEAVGHAVRAGYLYAGMADVAHKSGDVKLLEVCEKLFDNIVEKKMYITGGIGSTTDGEAFGKAYFLPNATAYAESCAAIALALFANRMLNITGNMKYAEVIEKTIYNGILSGISLSGDRYFYKNMLEVSPDTPYEKERQPWFRTSCCPTNFCRFLPQLGTFIWSESEEGVRLNIPVQCKMDSNGRKISVKSGYPYDGKILITIESDGEFTFACRIPAWCRKSEVRLNGEVQNVSGDSPEWKRDWKSGDTISLTLDMPVEVIRANTGVISDIGKTALCRGPIVYAIESLDENEELWRYLIDAEQEFELVPVEGLPAGTIGIKGKAMRETQRSNTLYSTEKSTLEEVVFTAVPYALWQNRGKSSMQVWTRELLSK